MRIVITGGDASGKSTVWDYLRSQHSSLLQEIPEMATALTGGMGGAKILPALGRDIDVTPSVLGLFQNMMRSAQLNSEDLWDIVARANGKKACILDRGIPDLAAYDEGGMPSIERHFGMSKDEIYSRYDIVINLRSLAVRNPQLYLQIQKENPSRTVRTIEEAVALDEAILEAWADHPNVIVLTGDIDEVNAEVERIVLEATSHEIEMKFYLGSRLPLIARSGYSVIIEQRQGYVFDDNGEMRVREEMVNGGGRYFLTVKSDGGLARMEWETSIMPPVFSIVWRHTAGRRIEKTRFIVKEGDYIYEIDLYKEPDCGVIVEVEFDSKEAADAFKKPSWLEESVDVTENEGFRAKRVAVHGFPKVA